MQNDEQIDEIIDTVNENLRLIHKKNGLTFGTDAYLLAAFVRPDARSFCVDLGSGTGILPLLLTTRGKVDRAVGVEIQTAFADLIARNAQINGLEKRVFSLEADVRTLSPTCLGTLLGAETAFADVVVCNPPYMPAGNGARNTYDEKYLARHEVCGGIDDFCAAAARILRYGGRFYVVFRPDRLTSLMASLRENHLEPKRMLFVHADVESEPSMVLIEAKAGAGESLKILPPLFLHDLSSRTLSSRPLSARAQAIYDTMTIL